MKITIGELNRKLNYLTPISVDINDKLSFHLKMFYDSVQSVIKGPSEAYQMAQTQARVDNALTDPDKKGQFILDDKGQYTFTKDGMTALIAANNTAKNIYEGYEVDMPVRLITVTPDVPGWARLEDFDDFLRKQFAGILFPVPDAAATENADAARMAGIQGAQESDEGRKLRMSGEVYQGQAKETTAEEKGSDPIEKTISDTNPG